MLNVYVNNAVHGPSVAPKGNIHANAKNKTKKKKTSKHVNMYIDNKSPPSQERRRIILATILNES